MLNLLPQTEKKQLIKDYQMRFAVTTVLFISVLLIAAIVGLFPSYISKRSEMETLVEKQDQAKQQNSQVILEEADRLSAANVILVDYLDTRVAELKSNPSTTDITKRIFSKKTAAISLSSISIIDKEVNIRGIAATRADLIVFRDAIKSEEAFKNSVLPIADLAKSLLADFGITITLP